MPVPLTMLRIRECDRSHGVLKAVRWIANEKPTVSEIHLPSHALKNRPVRADGRLSSGGGLVQRTDKWSHIRFVQRSPESVHTIDLFWRSVHPL
jgi:hypothetical protein